MAKNKTFGKVSVPDRAFDDSKATAHISIRLPLLLVKDLRRLALNEKHAGKYQVLIRDVLSDWVSQHTEPKRKRA